MFKFANVDLPDYADSPEVALWVEGNITPASIFPLAQSFWPGSITGVPLLQPTAWPYRPVTINTLYWPWSATRFARAHFVVNDARLNLIRKATEPGGVSLPAPLTIYDGNETVTTKLYMLPALPLSTAIPGFGNQPGDGVWLLTLVDERYWWWDTRLSFVVDGLEQTWLDVYQAISVAIKTSIQVDPIPGVYGIPTADYTIVNRPVPPFLDTVAFSVGQRIVRSLAGTVYAQNWSTANANSLSQSLLYTKYAGGKIALLPG